LSAGCLVVLLPWWTRNWLVAGTPFPGGGLQTLWLRDYEELFYLGQELTASRYLAWGLGPILASKLQAGLYNLYVMGGGPWPWLAPFAVVGAWAKRRDQRVRLALGYGLALWLAMTLAFTFPAQHGTAFHSASALVIWQAACVPAGIVAVVGWLTRWLRWDATRFSRYFLIRLTALAVIISLSQYGLIWLRVIQPELTATGWVNHGLDHYVVADQWLAASGAPKTEPILVRDPPSFYHVTGRRAVVLPRDLTFLDLTANCYGVRCAILEDAGIARLRRAQAEEGLTEWQEVMTASGRSNVALFCREGAP
jgi:hypothetical protein